MSKADNRILRSVREAQAFARGEVTEGFVVHEFVGVGALRARLGLDLPAFAERFGLLESVVRDWEEGRRVPNRPAQVLLRVIEAEPEVVRRVVARG